MTKRYYGYYNSPIGLLEIITSKEALLSVMFVEVAKDWEYVGENQEEPVILKETVKQLEEYFKGIRREFDLKVEIDGTEFQKAAWRALMEIPYGETWSYKKQAMYIGREKAVRAIGNANGKNLISIIIPCHRVIGSNKSLTGYAGGIDKKQWLLNHEVGV